jgi:hypothetical protein
MANVTRVVQVTTAILAAAAMVAFGCDYASGTAPSPTSPSSLTAIQWPDEAGEFVRLSDQPWDRIAQLENGGLMARARALIVAEPAPDDAWQYLRRSSSKNDDIVVDATAPFSPPHVLRIIFTPDMQKDHEPSVHWIALPSARAVYASWWIKLSPNWTSSPAGGGKMTFLHVAPSGQGQAYSGLFGSTAPHRVSINTEWPPYGQKIWEPNRETTPILYDRWYRIEWYVKWESRAGAGDAVIAWRVNGTLNGAYSNVRLPDGASAFQQFEFAPTLQDPPRAEQYMYIDHTSIAVK